MSGAKTKAFRVFYFLLITSGLPMLVGFLALDSAIDAAILYPASIALAYPLSLLPGRVGKKRFYPLRIPAAFLCAIAICALITLRASFLGVFFLRGTLFGLIAGALSLFAVREACLEDPMWTGTRGAPIGVVLYLIPGVALTYLPCPILKNLLWAMAILFLAVTGFYLNSQNMRSGMAARGDARPPRKLVTGNRVVTVLFAAVVAFVVFFDSLRQAFTAAAQWCVQTVILAAMWLTNLLNPGGGSAGGGEGGGDMSAMLGGLEQGETSAFWLAAEKVMIVIAILLGAGIAIFALYYIGKLLLRLFRFVKAYFERFARDASEEYTEEQEALFDLDDIREKTKERFRDAYRRLTERPKRWEQMDAREKVRFCVRALYKKAGDSISGLRTLTIREAAPKLPGAGDPAAIADVYERARYAVVAPSEQEAEALRKAVKP